MSRAWSIDFGGRVPTHDRHGHLWRRTGRCHWQYQHLERQLAHGWASDWSSLRAWVVWQGVGKVISVGDRLGRDTPVMG